MYKNILIFIVLIIAGITFAVADDKVQKKEITIIHAGTLLAVAGNEPLNKQSIIIEDGKIIDVRSSYISDDEFNDATVTIIDLKDKFVMAGLMDMHVHLAMDRGAGKNSADYALTGVKNAYKTLMIGFTTVRDLGASDDTIFKLRDAIEDGDVIGPRILSAGMIIGVGGRENGFECNGTESCRRTTRDMITNGADWIKIYSSCSGGALCSNEDGAPMFLKMK